MTMFLMIAVGHWPTARHVDITPALSSAFAMNRTSTRDSDKPSRQRALPMEDIMFRKGFASLIVAAAATAVLWTGSASAQVRTAALESGVPALTAAINENRIALVIGNSALQKQQAAEQSGQRRPGGVAIAEHRRLRSRDGFRS